MKKIFEIKKHDKEYPKQFQKEKRRIAEALGKNITIEHIGSTAISNLHGKGIIDILIAFSDFKEFFKVKQKLEQLGYIYKESAGNENRLFFSDKDLKSPDVKFHLHIVRKNSEEHLEPILFRDYLKKNPEEIQKYADLKISWLEKAKSPRDYLNAKTPYVKSVLKKAKKDL